MKKCQCIYHSEKIYIPTKKKKQAIKKYMGSILNQVAEGCLLKCDTTNLCENHDFVKSNSYKVILIRNVGLLASEIHN